MNRRDLLLLGAALPLAGCVAKAGPISSKASTAEPARTGIDILLAERLDMLKGKRVGLVTNHTGVTGDGVHDSDALLGAKVNLVALFSPEHGLRGLAQAGEKVSSGVDSSTGLPVHSLYGATKQPTPEMLKDIDVLLFDLQDVGARFYTYPSTLMLVLRAATKAGISVIILDRPNPLGGELLDGPVLEPAFASFVGIFAMPIMHGMTMGELAKMFVAQERMKVDLTVIAMQGWHPEGPFDFSWPLPWIAPSPNMRTLQTAAVYPGTALFEGTNISEGRGTDRPFEQIGAPFIEGKQIAEKLNAAEIPGAHFEPISFTPTSSKFAGERCGGVMLTVTKRAIFHPVTTGVAMVKAVHDAYPDDFRFLSGAPSFFDQLAGTAQVREAIIAGKSVADIEAQWIEGLDEFTEMRKPYLLY